MIKHKILFTIHRILWAVYWRIAIRLGTRDPDFPKEAWTDTRPRVRKIGDWIMDLDPNFKK